MKLLRIAVLASGNGSNFQAIVDQISSSQLPAQCALLLCDRENAFVRQRARTAGIPEFFLNPKSFADRHAFDQSLADKIASYQVDLIVLAGYMRILGDGFVKRFKNRIINLHPSLLPKFPGLNAIQQALDAGEKTTGCTVHIVDEQLDHGPILLQSSVEIGANDTLETLSERIHAEEHRLLPEAIRKIASGEISLNR